MTAKDEKSTPGLAAAQLLPCHGDDDFMRIVSDFPDPIFVKDEKGRWKFVNEAFCILFGIEPHTIIGKSDYEFLPVVQRNSFNEKDSTVLETKTPHECDEHFTDKAGRLFVVHTRRWISTASTGARMLVCTMHDITAAVKSRQLLEENNSRFHHMAAAAEEYFWETDPQERFRFLTPQAEKVFGMPVHALIGRRPHEFVHPEEETPIAELLSSTFHSQKPVQSFVFSIKTPDARRVWQRMSGYPIVNSAGEFEGYRGIGLDITQERLIQIDLEKALTRAELTSKAKSQFVANMSHEIRTPMNGILGMLQIMLDTPLSNDQRDLALIAKSSADSLLLVLNDILDISKIEAGRLSISPHPVRLATLFQEIEMMFSAIFLHKTISFLLDIRTELPPLVQVDDMRLRQVIVNLLSNAMKFTAPGGSVVMVVDGHVEENIFQLSLWVIDSGIGVPKEKQQEIFEAFKQADSTITRRFGGTGLGLTISSMIIELMGGTIDVRSQPNVGSVFLCTVPLLLSAHVEPLPNNIDPTGNRIPSIPGPGMRVLIAEDNEVNTKLLTALLTKRGHSFTIASNGEEALREFSTGEFDLVLMDVQMPVMNGEEATMKIRQMGARGATIPIVALTAHALSGDRDRFLDAGMNDYIAKPFTAKQLYSVLDKFRAPQKDG